MKRLKLTQNPFLLFLPFLVIGLIIVFIHPTKGDTGDESRYLIYGRYMIDGFLPPSELDFDHLGDGPGYSILLIPFIRFHFSLLWIAAMNAVFFYFSIIFLFKTIIKFLSFKQAFLVSLFWALYLNSYLYIGKVLPETLTSFLICLLCFSLTNAFNSRYSRQYMIVAGLTIGYLAITKPIFGYVLLFVLLITIILWLLSKKSKALNISVLILLVALFATTPYSIYTYRITGKVFYWSSFGGNNLYWMSSLDEQEYGSYFNDPGQPVDSITMLTHSRDFENQIILKHQKDFDEINKYKVAEKDDAFKRIAINNIKTNPGKFIQNCISNVGRLLFNFPYSYKIQSPYTLIRLPFNGIIVVLMLFCVFPAIKNWRKIDYSIRFMFLLAAVYFGGSILGSAETRMFTPIVPFLIVWIAFVLRKAVNINFGKWNDI